MLQFLARQTMALLELRKRTVLQCRLLLRARKAEQKKANFERMVRQTSDFIGIADERGEVIFLNRAARELVGLGPDVAIPVAVIDYIANYSADNRPYFRGKTRPEFLPEGDAVPSRRFIALCCAYGRANWRTAPMMREYS